MGDENLQQFNLQPICDKEKEADKRNICYNTLRFTDIENENTVYNGGYDKGTGIDSQVTCKFSF